MEWRQSLILSLVYALFLILGAVMFMHLECTEERHVDVKEPNEWQKLKGLALAEDSPRDEDELLVLATWLPRVCPNITNATIHALTRPGPQTAAVKEAEHLCPHLHQENVTVEVNCPWSFIDALHFSMTVTTTIGFGVLAPTTAGGRVVCMLYALVGIPLTGMLLAWSSEFFGEQLFKLFKAKLDSEKQQSKRHIALFTLFYIMAGVVVFIFIPAAVFMVLEEDWTYLDSIYYSFITLTTIGFGDYVTGNNMDGVAKYAYQIGVILWIMIGLGYWVMVANFITKALQSKKLQSSVMRSAEEMKKLMQHMGIKNNDPRFLRQHSKATLNFMLQLSNIIAVQGGVEGNSEGLDTVDTPSTSSTTTSPATSPIGIPGIASLFGPGMNRASPFAGLIGPLSRRVLVMSPDAEGKVNPAMEHDGRDCKKTTAEDTIQAMAEEGRETAECNEVVESSPVTLSRKSESQVTLQMGEEVVT